MRKFVLICRIYQSDSSVCDLVSVMNILYVLALTLAVASASDQCAWGESHWCSSLKNAKECGAFEHCRSTIWKNQKLVKDNSDVCTYCENVVTDVKGFITQKQTQDQIKHFVEAACSIIPEADMVKQCKDVVDNYLPEILILIETEMDPQTVCSLLGLCKGLEDTVQHRPMNTPHRVTLIKVPEAQVEPICTDCKKFMNDIKTQVTSATTEQQIEKLLEDNLCANLGGLADECNAMVKAYVPELLELLTAQFNPEQLCDVMGFCAKSGVTPRALLAKMKLTKSSLYKAGQTMADDADCEICKTLITELQTMEKDQKTQKEIEDFIKSNICAHLGALKGACEESVDEYGPELFQLLAQEMDPSTICQSIGLCNAVRLFNGIQPVLIEAPPTPKQSPKPLPLKDSAQCILCEFVIGKLSSMLKDNATEAEIQAALDKVCSLLPKTISQECQNFVDTYAAAVIAILSQEVNPQVVCTTLGLCSTQKNDLSRPRVVLAVGDTQFCGVCEMVMQYVDSLLTQNATVQEIEALFEKICNFLPKNYKTQCDDVVKQYGPAIIQMLSQFADPKEICTEIGLCSKTVKEVPMEEIVPSKANLLGANECTYGPAYWCANRDNAEKCQAVAHCKKHVWKN